MPFARQRPGTLASLVPHFLIWLLAGLLLLTTWVLAFSLIEDDYTRAMAGSERDLLNMGRLSQEHADRTFFSADQTLRHVRGQYREHNEKINLAAMAAQGLWDSRILHQVAVIDAQGWLNLSNLPFNNRIDLSDRAHFKTHVAPGHDALFISTPVLGRASGKWSIQLSRRINGQNGEFLGVVVASLDPAYFTQFYGDLTLGQDGMAALYDLKGTLFARKTTQADVFEGNASASPVFSRVAQGEAKGLLTYFSVLDGIERLYYFRQLPSYPLLVLIGIGKQDALVEHDHKKLQLLWQTTIACFLLLALATIASWGVLVGRRYAAAQQQALARLQTITSRAPGVLFQYVRHPDGSFHIPFVSEGIRDLYGLMPQEVLKSAAQVLSLIHPDDVPVVTASMDVSAQTLTPWACDFRVRFEDGTVRWQSGKATPEQQTDGSVLWYGFISDATQLKKTQESLLTLSAAVEQSPVSIVITNPKGLIQYVNPMFEQVTGYRRAEVLGRNPRFLSSGDKSTSEYQTMWEALTCGKTWSGEFHNRRKDGSLFWEQSTIAPILDDRGIAINYLAIKEDITERKRMDAQLRIAAIAFESEEGMFITDAAGSILRVNQAFTRITGYMAEEAIGKNPSLLSSGRHDIDFYEVMWACIQQTGTWQGEIWNRRKNGDIYPEWLSITAVKDDQQTLTHYVGMLADITKRKAAEAEILHLAFYDPLTGLPNRRLLMERLGQALASNSRHPHTGALLFIDLDNFKNLNDTLGHDQGDLLLKMVAGRLNYCVCECDTVARLGGDEFVVMLQDLNDNPTEAAVRAEVVAEKILAALRQPYQFSHVTHHSSASLGVTLFNKDNDSVDELLKRADLALYEAKDAGRNTLRFFDPEMQATISARAELEADLRKGLAAQQFVLYYQPQVDEQDQLIGVEALVRWHHPTRGMVSPADFIPLAEETRLILPLGQWVLETACRQLKAWAGQVNTAHLTLAVNVSALQFHRENFVQEVLDTLKRTGAPAARLKLELTESLLVKDIEGIIAKMLALKAQGVGFSLDDFGTGYSSLSYLKRLPLDQLKIDQSFLHEALTNPKDAAIVSATVALGKSLGMMVIAEGVETQAQRDFLEGQGCEHYQGYYFGRPGPVEALDKFFESDFADE